MRRREFIKLLGGAAAAWPVAARAQRRERMRSIGLLMPAAANDSEYQARVGTFLQALALLGWSIGRNVQIETRWATADPAELRRHAAELVALAPDVVVASSSPTVVALEQATRTVPIVFASVTDPVGAGFVTNLARPGGNVTGFESVEYGLSGKWLGLLKEIAPGVRRAAVIRDAALTLGVGQFAAIQAVAPSLGVELSPVGVQDADEIARGISAVALTSNGGLIVTSSPVAAFYRNLIIGLAAKHRLPTVYANRYFVADGGLISYGPDTLEPYRLVAGYVDRILKGEKPGDLPVQAPTKYELCINLKTAKVTGIDIPATVLVRADEVIE